MGGGRTEGIQGFYRDTGKENGSYCLVIGYVLSGMYAWERRGYIIGHILGQWKRKSQLPFGVSAL